jgi:hypothetical protein
MHGASELAALNGLANESPFALGNCCAEKLTVALPSFRLALTQREITRIEIESLAPIMTQAIPAA